MLTLDPTLLAAIASQAKAKAAQHPRWLVAIDRALVELDTNPYIAWQDGHLLILSESGAIYAANGTCQCKAYAFKNPCWHRAAARLVRLYFEALAVQQAAVVVVTRLRQTANESVVDLFGS